LLQRCNKANLHPPPIMRRYFYPLKVPITKIILDN